MGVQVLARPGSGGDSRFTEFGISVVDASVHNCSNWAVRAESLTDQSITGFRLTDCVVDATSTSGGNGANRPGPHPRHQFRQDLGHALSADCHLQRERHEQSVDLRFAAIDQAGRSIRGRPTPSAIFDNCEGAIHTMQ